MTTYTFRSINGNDFFQKLYISTATIVTNDDANTISYELGSGFSSSDPVKQVDFDTSQVASSGASPLPNYIDGSFGEVDDLFDEQIYLGWATWGDSNEYTSLLLIMGSDLNLFLQRFIDPYAIVVVDGDLATTESKAISLSQTLTFISPPSPVFGPGSPFQFEQFTSFASKTENDEMSGDGSVNILSGGLGNDRIDGLGGNDILDGGVGNDTIYAGAGNDKVYDGGGNDKIYLGSGNDYVIAGTGGDDFNGGAGRDWISYYHSVDGVTVNLGANSVSGGRAKFDTISDFECVLGSKNGNDVISGTSGSNTIKTYGGNDTVYDGAGRDRIFLGDGNDMVVVGGGRDFYDGGAGKDWISYFNSPGGVSINLETNQVLRSWADDDTIMNFECVMGSNVGNDVIKGTSGANTIRTYGGKDSVYACAGNDKVYLGAGNDYVKAGTGSDLYHGGAGKDLISYYKSSGGVTIDLGKNSASGSLATAHTIHSFEDVVGSKIGDDTLAGTGGQNTLKSYGGDDKLWGRNGNDRLLGGDGADRLDGGAGRDVLFGGADADVFHFDHGADHDIIKDFEDNIDTIELDNFSFGAGQDAFDFASQAGSDVVFDFSGGDMLTVENTTISVLQNDLILV